jgi:fructose-specific phosphotransferase system IIC component
MKSKKTIDMSKWRNLIITNIIAIIAIIFLNSFFNINYSNDGSLDIIIGAFIEVLILGAYFEFINQRGQKNLENRLQEHLKQLEENLIRRSRNNA